MRIHYLLLALFSFDLHVSGQEVNITFDEKDYGSVSAYDYWTGSPLSERQLDRLAEVTDNPFSDARNSGGKVLSFRRSHHGSHLCGAKITLIEPLGLTPKTGYLHVMVHKPLSGKMELIGLGKRKGWDSQDENTMQFIKSSVRDIPAGQWEDAVFELYGNDMAELHSIVITADTKSCIASDEDYMAYFDNIVINDNPEPRFSFAPYAVDTDADTKRNIKTESLCFTACNGNSQKISLENIREAYCDKTASAASPLRIGDEYKTSLVHDEKDNMHVCLYMDRNDNGMFDDGELISSHNLSDCGSFMIPADTKPGIYRMRCKIDAKSSTGNSLYNPSHTDIGVIIDFLVNIHSDQVRLDVASRMCDVSAEDGSPLPASIPFGKDFRFRVDMDSDYTLTGLEIKHGYRHDGSEYVNGNRQWKHDTIQPGKDGLLTIPAKYIDGDVSVTILFENK